MSKIAVITPQSTDTPRVRRGVAGVIAQYIQDLSHPYGSGLTGAHSHPAAA